MSDVSWRLAAEQEELRARAREVAMSLRDRVLEVPDCCDYPDDLFAVLVKEHMLGLEIPIKYDGGGHSLVSQCVVIEELARISATVALMAAYVSLTALPIMLAGTEEQKERFIPPLVRGEKLGSYALTEPDVGSDPSALQTKAERHGDSYLLNGEKRFIGNAGRSDTYVVFARTGGEGARGISAFIVDGQAEGVSADSLRTMGMPGWHLGAPHFHDVEVPVENRLGEEGDGFRIAMMTFDRSRPVVAAQSVGVGQGAVDLALDYASRRRTFGHPLMEHEGIQFKLARMETDVAAGRALTYQAASAVDAGGEDMTKLAAMAKLVASDAAMRVTTEAVQVLGGNGYLKDFPAERMMRDAKVLQIYEGANEIQQLVIARQMVKLAGGRDPVWPQALPGSAGVTTGEGEGHASSEKVGARV